MANEILHIGVRAYKITVTNKDGEEVYAVFDRTRYPNFVTTTVNQMISNTLAAVLRDKGEAWGMEDYRVLTVDDPHA